MLFQILVFVRQIPLDLSEIIEINIANINHDQTVLTTLDTNLNKG